MAQNFRVGKKGVVDHSLVHSTSAVGKHDMYVYVIYSVCLQVIVFSGLKLTQKTVLVKGMPGIHLSYIYQESSETWYGTKPSPPIKSKYIV